MPPRAGLKSMLSTRPGTSEKVARRSKRCAFDCGARRSSTTRTLSRRSPAGIGMRRYSAEVPSRARPEGASVSSSSTRPSSSTTTRTGERPRGQTSGARMFGARAASSSGERRRQGASRAPACAMLTCKSAAPSGTGATDGACDSPMINAPNALQARTPRSIAAASRLTAGMRLLPCLSLRTRQRCRPQRLERGAQRVACARQFRLVAGGELDHAQALARHALAQNRLALAGQPLRRQLRAQPIGALARTAGDEQRAVGAAAQRVLDERRRQHADAAHVEQRGALVLERRGARCFGAGEHQDALRRGGRDARQRRFEPHALALHVGVRHVDARGEQLGAAERRRRRAGAGAQPAGRAALGHHLDLPAGAHVRRGNQQHRLVGAIDHAARAAVAVRRVDHRGNGLRARKQRGQRDEQQRRAAGGEPQEGGRGRVHQRMHEQDEPVELDRRGQAERVPGRLRGCRAQERRGEQHGEGGRHQAARRDRLRLADALHMDPHAGEQRQRQADVQEDEQREQPVAHALRAEEVARHRLGGETGRVEPFRRGERRDLRARVPHQPVADDARGVHQPQQRHAGDPGEAPKAAEAPRRPLAHQVQQRRGDEGVGGVAVHAARDAPRPPLLGRQRLDRRVGALDAGVEKDEEVNPGRGEHPEEEKRQRAEVAQRVGVRAEGRIEPALHGNETPIERVRRGHQEPRKSKPPFVATKSMSSMPPGESSSVSSRT